MLTDLLTPSEQPEVKVVRKFEQKEGKRRSALIHFIFIVNQLYFSQSLLVIVGQVLNVRVTIPGQQVNDN